MSERDEIVIIGAGVTGLAIGVELAQRGHRVRLLEAFGREHGGATAGNAGMIVPSHFIPLAAPGVAAKGLLWLLRRSSPLAIAPRPSPALISFCWKFLRAATAENVARSAELLRDLHLKSRSQFLALAEAAGTSEERFDLSTRGILVACRTAEGLEEEEATAVRARELGVPAEIVTGAALAALDPALAPELAGGVHYPLDAHLSPDRFLNVLRRRLLAAGGGIEAGCRVVRLAAVRGEVRVETSHGTLAPTTLVLAAGVETGRLAVGLGVALPLQPGKGYSLTDPAPPVLPALPALLHEDRVAVTPMGGRLRVAGTLELGAPGPAINHRRVKGILAALPRFYRGLDSTRLAAQPVWSGLRPCTPDGLPYFGSLTRYPRLFVASGAGMMGLSLAPVTGELVADWIEGKPGWLPPQWCRLLAPERFTRA